MSHVKIFYSIKYYRNKRIQLFKIYFRISISIMIVNHELYTNILVKIDESDKKN